MKAVSKRQPFFVFILQEIYKFLKFLKKQNIEMIFLILYVLYSSYHNYFSLSSSVLGIWVYGLLRDKLPH